MDRREVVRRLGIMAAVPFLPGTAVDASVLVQRVHEALQGGATFRTFDRAQQELVGGLVDAILPRTDTPGAVDVRVPEFIDHIVTDWATAAERRAVLDGLTEIDTRVRAEGATTVQELDPPQRARLLQALDAERGSGSKAGHAYWQVKSLAVYGYFTSETVQRDVLKTPMFFAAFDSCAPA